MSITHVSAIGIDHDLLGYLYRRVDSGIGGDAASLRKCKRSILQKT